MLINRHNYEEFFLLYVDNELTVAERKAVEDFVEQNADLEEELVMMMQSVLRPDKNIVFGNKESLLKNKSANGLVNESNYEEYFVLYGDNELSNEEKDLVEQFVYKHPQYQAEFELIQQARFIPEHAILYPDKNELYRTEGDHRVIPFGWWKMAAAAIVILMLGLAAWYMTRDNQHDNSAVPGYAAVEDSSDKATPAPKEQLAETEAKGQQPDAVVKEDKKAIDKKSPVEDVQNNTANVDPEKNIKKKSNIPVTPNVEPIKKDEVMANNDQDKQQRQPVETQLRTANPIVDTAQTRIDITSATALNNPGSVIDNPKPAREVVYFIEESTEENIKKANASLDNKKPVGKLLRKVKGLFDSKEDNNDPDRENKKGISIAAFEIALK